MANDTVQNGNTTTWTFVSGVSATVEAITQLSVDQDASGIKLKNDSATPGNSKYYGTDSSGTKGFFTVPGGGGSITVEEVDGTPSVVGVTTIKVSNGTLTDDGGGVVTIQTGGGGGGTATVKVKSTDQLVANNNTTYISDTDLTFAVAAGETWVAQFCLLLSIQAGGPNIDYQISGPAGATIAMWTDSINFTALPMDSPNTGVALSSSFISPLLVTASIVNGATPGNIVFQFKQSTNNVNAVISGAGSSVVANKQ